MSARVDLSTYPHITNLMDEQGMYQRMDAYLEWMQLKNYSAYTMENNEQSILLFMEWCGQRGLIRPNEITKPILERYQRYLYYYRQPSGAGLTFSSQRIRLSCLKSWFKWLAKENYLLYNPASELDLPKVPKRLPKAVLSEKEVEVVLAQADVTDLLGLRDRTIMEVLYSTGMRRMEVINLNVFDIDQDRGTAMIRQGKGQRDRLVPIGERALDWVTRYQNDVRPELSCGRDEGALFLSRFAERLTANALSRRIAVYIDQAKVGKQGSCHLFRHTMATLMLENGADVRLIQAILGHASLETTERYTHLSIKHLKSVHAQTHPSHVRKVKA